MFKLLTTTTKLEKEKLRSKFILFKYLNDLKIKINQTNKPKKTIKPPEISTKNKIHCFKLFQQQQQPQQEKNNKNYYKLAEAFQM